MNKKVDGQHVNNIFKSMHVQSFSRKLRWQYRPLHHRRY